MPRYLTFVLAGGEGERLRPLTEERAKPAVPFGGRYRIIDFVLSNLVNSHIYQIKVLTQFKSDSLNRHLRQGWTLSPVLDHYVDPVPAQMRTGRTWYRGSADAVFQNLNLITDERPESVLLFGGDHIYKMNVRQMIDFHERTNADVTVSAIPFPIHEASSFGIIEVDREWRMKDFHEKPEHPKPIPGDEHHSLVSMGIYIFRADLLIDAVTKDAEEESSKHDFGRNIIPALFKTHRVMVYDFSKNMIPGMTSAEAGYWRDIGSIDAYWKASMDLVSVTPLFNLYNGEWPLHSTTWTHPPAKFVFADEQSKRIGMATDSLVSEGCIISGGRINRAILSPGVRINSFSLIEESILFEHVTVGRHTKVRRAIIDKGVEIPSGIEIGFDLERDRQKYFVSPEGVVVIPKGMRLSS